MQVGFHHPVKQGEGQFGQCQGQNQGDACLNHAFGKKLADKDTAFGTGYFPYAYFFVAQRSAGGGQRREVECSHEDNQESQSDEKIDGGSVSVVLYVRIREPRMEMNVVQGLESQTHVRLPLFGQETAHFMRLVGTQGSILLHLDINIHAFCKGVPTAADGHVSIHVCIHGHGYVEPDMALAWNLDYGDYGISSPDKST